MEEHVILSERLEDQLKAVEWAKAEQKIFKTFFAPPVGLKYKA